jgi:hypothetical protein
MNAHSLNAKSAPEWLTNQSRIIVGEDISHWGTGLGKTPEIALFKAEFMAIRSITKECGGYTSKGIYIPKKHVKPHGKVYLGFARANISFAECDYDKTPMAKTNKDLNNPYLDKGLKLYDKLIDDEFNKKKNIKETMNKVLEFLKIKNKEQDSRLKTIENEIQKLKNKPINQNIIINRNEIHIHGTKAKYAECLQEYDEIMYEAQQKSYKNKIPGNLVGENSRSTYNKAQRKLYICNQMKVD